MIKILMLMMVIVMFFMMFWNKYGDDIIENNLPKRQSAQDSGVSWLQEMANELKFIFLVNLKLILFLSYQLFDLLVFIIVLTNQPFRLL